MDDDIKMITSCLSKYINGDVAINMEKNHPVPDCPYDIKEAEVRSLLLLLHLLFTKYIYIKKVSDHNCLIYQYFNLLVPT